MNQTLMSYLIPLAVACVVWVIFGVFLILPFSETLSLASVAVEVFVARCQVFFGIAITLSLALVAFWIYNGKKDSTLANLDNVKRLWYQLVVVEAVIAIVLAVILFVMHAGEGLTVGDDLILLIGFFIMTVGYFALCTFFFSPTNVIYAVPLRK